MRILKRSAILVTLLLAGCSVLSTLEAVVNATAAAVPILQAAGVAVPAAAVTYIDAIAACAGDQNGSTAPTGSQVLAIAGCMAAQIQPILPPGTASTIVAIVGQVAQDVAKFLAQHPPTVALNAKASHPTAPGYSAKLKQIEAKAAGVHGTLKSLKH